MNKLKIALCQMNVIDNKQENILKATSMINEAAKNNSNFIVLPEMFNCPYSNDKFVEYAENEKSIHNMPWPNKVQDSNLTEESGILYDLTSVIATEIRKAKTNATKNKNFTAVDGLLCDKDGLTLYVYPGGRKQETYRLPQTLTGIVNKGYMTKEAGTPVKYRFVDDIDELLAMDNKDGKKGCDKTHLEQAKAAKKNEFYTMVTDVEMECSKYRQQFRGKRIFCNCNDGEEHSAFWDYFRKNFDAFGLDRLTAISYKEKNGCGVKREIRTETFVDEDTFTTTILTGDGGFESEESLAVLDECDIVIDGDSEKLLKLIFSIVVSPSKVQALTLKPNSLALCIFGEFWYRS